MGYRAGRNKDAVLGSKAFSRVNVDLDKIQSFHTNRGNEFKNKTLDETLETFHIRRSLGMKGCPYDHAVAEATFKIIKTEFIKGQKYENLEQLPYELSEYVNWSNNHRIHSSLSYMPQKNTDVLTIKKLSKKVLTIQFYFLQAVLQ